MNIYNEWMNIYNESAWADYNVWIKCIGEFMSLAACQTSANVGINLQLHFTMKYIYK